MYSPTLGRFITRDPIGFDANDVDLYRTEGNNPINRLDPTGLVAIPSTPSHTDGAKGAIDAMVDKLHWPEDRKARIKAFLRGLIDTAQFEWHRPKGPAGKCQRWVDEIYPKVRPILVTGRADGIKLERVDFRTTFVDAGKHTPGHGAVRIEVADSPGSNPNNSFSFYLDDGWVGGEDHVFVDSEIPARFRRNATWPWRNEKESLDECGCESPIGPDLYWDTPGWWPTY